MCSRIRGGVGAPRAGGGLMSSFDVAHGGGGGGGVRGARGHGFKNEAGPDGDVTQGASGSRH